ncbi:MAG: sodium/proline symporter PutP, partial [Pseudomonadales bacterium]|nr:sodium/proline symporter PutP [Pseudomonadales bacterium]
LLLGLPGVVDVSGSREAWILVCLVIGAWLNWTYVARPLRVVTEELNCLTLPDYLERRFDDHSKLLRLVSAVVILLFFTFYAASGLVAGARLFAASFELSYLTALLIGAVVIVGYTTVGGFLAVSWTDFVQGLLMLLAMVVVPVVMLMQMGGPVEAVEFIARLDPDYVDLFSGVSFMGVISLMAWGLGYFGQPHILARFMAIGDPDNVKSARRIGMSWMIVTTIGAVAVGLIGIGWLAWVGQPLASNDSEKVFIVLTQLIFNPWVGGVLLAAILAAIMSTIDSQLLVSSSALSEDFYKTWLRPEASDRQLVIVGRVTVLIIAAIAILIALDPESKVLGLVSYAWAGLGASFGPVVLISIYWREMTRNGALAGMITGAVTVVVWKQLEGGLFDIYELLPA